MTLTFRKYLELEQHRKQLSEASRGNEFPDRVFAYLSLASLPVDEGEVWESTVFSFLKAERENQPDPTLPLIRKAPKRNPSEKSVEWDYPTRSWADWANIFARAYGWSLEYIGNLEVNEAFQLAQEILTDEQLGKEFVYSLSEVAYEYDKNTKKSRFRAMPRPYWMRPDYKEVKKIKVKRKLLPVGNVIDATGLSEEYGIKNYISQSQTTDPPAGT